MEYESVVENIIIAVESKEAVIMLLRRFDCAEAKIQEQTLADGTVSLRVRASSEMSYFSEAHGEEREIMDDVAPFLIKGQTASHRVVRINHLDVQGWSMNYTHKGRMRTVSLEQDWGTPKVNKPKN